MGDGNLLLLGIVLGIVIIMLVTVFLLVVFLLLALCYGQIWRFWRDRPARWRGRGPSALAASGGLALLLVGLVALDALVLALGVMFGGDTGGLRNPLIPLAVSVLASAVLWGGHRAYHRHVMGVGDGHKAP